MASSTSPLLRGTATSYLLFATPRTEGRLPLILFAAYALFAGTFCRAVVSARINTIAKGDWPLESRRFDDQLHHTQRHLWPATNRRRPSGQLEPVRLSHRRGWHRHRHALLRRSGLAVSRSRRTLPLRARGVRTLGRAAD